MPDSGQSSAAGRADILAAATDLFAEAGYDAVSMQAISRRAGTSKANVFHHFGSKDNLYLEVMRAACGRFATARELAVGPGGAADHAGRVVEFLRGDLEQLRGDDDRAHLILREVLESSPGRGQALASEVFDDHFQLVVELFREGQSAGVFATDIRPEVAAMMMIAPSVFVFQSRHVMRHLVGTEVIDDPERYAAMAGRILVDGLRARRGEDS